MLIITMPLNKSGFQALLKQRCKTHNTGGGQNLANIMAIKRIAANVASTFFPDPILAASFQFLPYANGKRSLDLRIFIKDRFGHYRAHARDGTKAHDQMQYAPSRAFAEGFASIVNYTPETKIGEDNCLAGSMVHRHRHAV